MKQFIVNEKYLHTGKEFYIRKRTEKSVWVSSGSVHAKPSLKRIKIDSQGNEYIIIDEFRSLHAVSNIKS